MKPSERLNAHREAVCAIVAANRASNPRVFGSVARGEDTDQSDVDISVDPNPRMGLFDIGGIQYRLSELLGVHVDVSTPDALPEKFRNDVLGEAVPI